MRVFNLTCDKGRKSGKEHFIILDSKEAVLLHGIVQEYCEKNKRKKNAKKLLDNLDNLECYFLI